MAKPFKTVTTSLENTPKKTRRIRVVTTTTEYCGSYDDPAVIKVYSYL